MISALGETTAGPSLPRLRDSMLKSPEGRRILKDRPRINSDTIDLKVLSQLPENTFGRAYFDWLERCGVTPDTREPVRIKDYSNAGWHTEAFIMQVHYVSDPELAFVMQRYRECHDFYHTICSMPVSVSYELALKFFEFANLGLPVAGISAAFGPLRLTSKQRTRLYSDYVPWALRCGSSSRCLIDVYWEERWAQDIVELKNELGIWDPPPAVWPKKLTEAAETAKKKGPSVPV